MPYNGLLEKLYALLNGLGDFYEVQSEIITWLHLGNTIYSWRCCSPGLWDTKLTGWEGCGWQCAYAKFAFQDLLFRKWSKAKRRMFLRSRRLALHYFAITSASLTVAAANSLWETIKSLSNSLPWSDVTIFKAVYRHSKIPRQLPLHNWVQSSSVLVKFA